MAHELLQMLQDVVVTWRAAASSRVVSIARSKLLLQRDERPPRWTSNRCAGADNVNALDDVSMRELLRN